MSFLPVSIRNLLSRSFSKDFVPVDMTVTDTSQGPRRISYSYADLGKLDKAQAIVLQMLFVYRHASSVVVLEVVDYGGDPDTPFDLMHAQFVHSFTVEAVDFRNIWPHLVATVFCRLNLPGTGSYWDVFNSHKHLPVPDYAEPRDFRVVGQSSMPLLSFHLGVPSIGNQKLQYDAGVWTPAARVKAKVKRSYPKYTRLDKRD